MEGAEHADDEFGGFAGTTITKSKSRVSHKRKSPSTTTSKVNRATTSEKEERTGQKKRAKSHKRTLSKGNDTTDSTSCKQESDGHQTNVEVNGQA